MRLRQLNVFSGGFIRLGRAWRAPVLLHWTAIPGAILFAGMTLHPAAWGSLLLVILVHEFGHAWWVRAFRLRVTSIELLPIGGVCRWEGTTSPINRSAIAWGGVLAQVMLASVANWGSSVLQGATPEWVGRALSVLVVQNLAIAAINLLPVPPLDGAEAFKLFPLLWRRAKRRQSKARAVAVERRLKAIERVDAVDEISAKVKAQIDEAMTGKRGR